MKFFLSYAFLTNCSVCRTVPGVLIINHRLQDLLINPVFGAYLAVGTLVFPFDGKKYTPYDEVSLIFSLFCLTVHLSKCTRGLLHKPPVFEICLALRAQVSTQYVRCFCQELVLRHFYIGLAISFIVGNSCASFPPFWDLCTF